MTAASRPMTVKLRSGDLVLLRQIRPADAPNLARAYESLGEQSRYRRFFTLMPHLSEHVLKRATEVDHDQHEALVATPLLSKEIIGECRFVRLADQPDTADLAVTVVDDWQGRGLGSALLARLSERALEVGVTHFTAEILAENRTVLGMLPYLGRFESRSQGSVISARIEIGEPALQAQQDLLELLTAAARGEIVSVPGPLRRLIEVEGAMAHIVLMPVTTLLRAMRGAPHPSPPPPSAAQPPSP
jgi:RimJ/RimL family protein N-acetyltransferase